MAGQPDCPFCAIVHGSEKDVEVEVLLRTQTWVAFLPKTPATPGHSLIVPRRHIPDVWSASPSLAAELGQAVVRIGDAIQKALSPGGMNLISSAGSAAEQTVFHAHLHVVPRWEGDAIGPIWPPKRPVTDRVEEDVADRIRAAL